MPQKAKYTEEDYLAIKKDLEGASDSNEANEVFVAHAEEHKANYTALKNGYVRKGNGRGNKEINLGSNFMTNSILAK